MAPPAASSPKALPPAMQTRVDFVDHVRLTRASIWRVPAAEPRTSALPTVPGRAEDYGAAGEILEITGMAHQESLNPGNHGRLAPGGGGPSGWSARDGEEIEGRLLFPLGVEPLEPGQVRNGLEGQQLLGQRRSGSEAWRRLRQPAP